MFLSAILIYKASPVRGSRILWTSPTRSGEEVPIGLGQPDPEVRVHLPFLQGQTLLVMSTMIIVHPAQLLMSIQHEVSFMPLGNASGQVVLSWETSFPWRDRDGRITLQVVSKVGRAGVWGENRGLAVRRWLINRQTAPVGDYTCVHTPS